MKFCAHFSFYFLFLSLSWLSEMGMEKIRETTHQLNLAWSHQITCPLDDLHIITRMT